MSSLTHEQQREARELLASLVEIDSVNESDAHGDRVRSEARIGALVEGLLLPMGMSVERYPLARAGGGAGRDNLVAYWPEADGEHSFALQAHMDTVTASGMTIDPFAAEIRDGRMWGRGTCDTKGSMAAFLTALRIAWQNGWRFVDRVHFVATAAEETGCRGASALVDSGFSVDAMVVGEPTNCQLVTAHKGTYWARLDAAGASCHASTPHHGHNAVYAMGRALRFIEQDYAPSLEARGHPLLGSPTVSVGRVEGGGATNIVPDACSAYLDFRILPDQSSERVHDEFLQRLRAACPDERFTLSAVQSQPGVQTPADAPWVRVLLAECQRFNGQSAPAGVQYFADSGPFAAAGIQCVLFGPGDIAQAHTPDEYLELAQLYKATELTLAWLDRAQKRSLVA